LSSSSGAGELAGGAAARLFSNFYIFFLQMIDDMIIRLSILRIPFT
jgi:hypothetical protein